MSSHGSDMLKAPYDAYVKQLSKPLWEKTCLFEAGVGRNINGNSNGKWYGYTYNIASLCDMFSIGCLKDRNINHNELGIRFND